MCIELRKKKGKFQKYVTNTFSCTGHSIVLDWDMGCIYHDSYADLTRQSKVFLTQPHASHSKGDRISLKSIISIFRNGQISQKGRHCS